MYAYILNPTPFGRQVISLNCFDIQMTLTFDPKINRGHLLAKTNAHTKFEGQRVVKFLIGNRFLPTRSM
jgi:hypothetical protein